MTEHDWLTSTNPAAMLRHLTTEYNTPDSPLMWHSRPRHLPLASNRKLRLYGAGAPLTIKPPREE